MIPALLLYLHRTVELLKEEHTAKLMGERHLTQPEDLPRPLPDCVVQAKSAAKNKDDGISCVAMPLESGGKFF